MSNNWQGIPEVIKEKDYITIVCHMNPDGDALGSMLGLGLALEQLNKKVVYMCPDPVPAQYKFLPGSERVSILDPNNINSQLLIFVDCSDEDRVGQKFLKHLPATVEVINLDHHVSNTFFGKYNYVDIEAAATGEIILELLKLLDVDLTHETASNLYVAISTDTGSFKFPNTTSKTHSLAAELLDTGINLSEITGALYEEVPMESFEVLKLGLANLKIHPEGKLAYIALTRQEIMSVGASDEHVEGLVGYAKAIAGIEIGVLFKEVADDGVKVSFRSKGKVDVAKLAGRFGGGGHKRASGCRLNENLNNAVNKIITAALEELKS